MPTVTMRPSSSWFLSSTTNTRWRSIVASSERSAFGPPNSSVAAAALIDSSAGGLVSRSMVASCCGVARCLSQMAPPMPTVAASCASRIDRKNFQNNRPTGLLLDQLVAQAVDGLQTGAAVGDATELVAQAAQMDVDVAVEARHRPAQSLLGQDVLADRLTGMARQHFEQIEFGAGQFQRGAGPCGAALFRPHGQLADLQRAGRRGVLRHSLRAAQDGADARRQLARRARLGHVIVGAQFQADDAVGVVAAAGQHQDRQLAARADAAQRLQPVHARHHDVEDGDRILAGEGGGGAGLAVVRGLHLEAFLLQIFLEHADQFDVVVYQQYLAHCMSWACGDAAIITNKRRRSACFYALLHAPAAVIFTRFYVGLTALYTAGFHNDDSNIPSGQRVYESEQTTRITSLAGRRDGAAAGRPCRRGRWRTGHERPGRAAVRA